MAQSNVFLLLVEAAVAIANGLVVSRQIQDKCPQSVFFCTDGIKQRNTGLVRQMPRHMNVLCYPGIWPLENHYGFATEIAAYFHR
jgi:hypothetical protein